MALHPVPGIEARPNTCGAATPEREHEAAEAGQHELGALWSSGTISQHELDSSSPDLNSALGKRVCSNQSALFSFEGPEH